MRCKHLCILLLLQSFLFIQCTIAETSNVGEGKGKNGITKSADGVTDTNAGKPITSDASNVSKKPASPNTTNNVKQSHNFKQIDFGFNIGYLADLKNTNLFAGPLNQIKQDGISKLRIYEPFTKNIVQQPGIVPKLISPLVQSGFKILLCLSNFPDVSQIQYDRSTNSQEQNQMMNFTNRNAPVNMDAYDSYLSDFLNKLQNQNLLNDVSFEIGNEPDAKKYFWGNTSDFIRVAKSVKQTIAKYNKPVYCCGFTSEFANQGAPNKGDYYNFLNDNPFFENVNLSFHFYQNDKFDVTQIKLPRLNNSIITEFNMYSFQKTSTVGKNAATNSAQFGSLLIRALVFTYRNNIKSIYFFKLVDIPNKEGTTGFFDVNGNAKPSYQYFKDIYDVVKNEYAVEQTNDYISIIGNDKTIYYAVRNNVAIPNNAVVSSSGNYNGKTLGKDEWVIEKN